MEWQRRGEEPVPELEQGKSTSFVSCPSYDSCCPTSHPCCISSPAYGFAVHNQWSSLVSASLVLSQGAHAGNITNAGMVYAGGSSPPPLIRAPEMSTHIYCPPASSPLSQTSYMQRPLVESPLWLVFVFGNVSRCNGYKGKILRDVNKRSLSPPDDIVFGHKEYFVFNNPRMGLYEQSREKKNVYYHVLRSCVVPHFADFSSHHIIIPDNVMPLLQVQHKECSGSYYVLCSYVHMPII